MGSQNRHYSHLRPLYQPSFKKASVKLEIFFYLCAVIMNNMEQNTLKKNMWNSAGKAGLALGAVSSAYLFASHLFSTDAESPHQDKLQSHMYYGPLSFSHAFG